MQIPESLRERIELFRQGGQAYAKDGELFTVDSWISVMMGQGIEPRAYNPVARLNERELKEYMRKYHAKVAEVVNALPPHADFVRHYCAASPETWNFTKA